MVKAVFKKDESRVFTITAFDGETITMFEGDDSSKPKDIKRKTFIKAYKIVEGTLENVQAQTALMDDEQPSPPRLAPVATAQPSNIASLLSYKPAGRIWRELEITLSEGVTIENINESDFIEELVNNFGALHGDKAKIGGKALGFIDLNGEEPTFGMTNPTVIPKETLEQNDDGDSITFVYAASGRKITMSRSEYYSLHQVGATRKSGNPAIQEDTLPEIMQDAPKPQWNLVGVGDGPNANTMRANRDAKLGEAQPFIPEPFFLRQSMISSYMQCPDKMYDSYENGYSEDSIFTKVGTAIHGIMEDYYNDPENANVPELFQKWWTSHAVPDWDWYRDWEKMVNTYFEKQKGYDKPNIIATEVEFRTVVEGVPVSGTIDRIDRVDAHTIRLVDYKTNFRPWTESELQESIQFQMYTLAVSSNEVRETLRSHGDTGEFDTILCTYDMLRLGYRQHTQFNVAELETFARWMKMIWTKILSGSDREPKLNQYCGYCQKRHKCSLYQEVLNAPIQSILTENTDVDKIVDERERLASNAKLIKNRLEEIDEQIKTKIAENKGELEIGDYVWTTKSGTTNHFPAQKVIQMLAMHGYGGIIPDVMNLSVTNLRKALKDDKDMVIRIESLAQQTYKAPSLNKKKKGK